jgi:hypothetical protein
LEDWVRSRSQEHGTLDLGANLDAKLLDRLFSDIEILKEEFVDSHNLEKFQKELGRVMPALQRLQNRQLWKEVILRKNQQNSQGYHPHSQLEFPSLPPTPARTPGQDRQNNPYENTPFMGDHSQTSDRKFTPNIGNTNPFQGEASSQIPQTLTSTRPATAHEATQNPREMLQKYFSNGKQTHTFMNETDTDVVTNALVSLGVVFQISTQFGLKVICLKGKGKGGMDRAYMDTPQRLGKMAALRAQLSESQADEKSDETDVSHPIMCVAYLKSWPLVRRC